MIVSNLISKCKDILFGDRCILQDVIKIYGFQIFTIVISLIIGILVARTLGPASKGIFDLFMLLNSFIIEIGLFGVGSGLLYHLANQKTPLSKIHGTGITFSILLGLGAVLLGYLLLPLWMHFFPNLDQWIILTAFFIAPFAFYKLIWTNIMMGCDDSPSIYRLGLYFSVIQLPIILILWHLDLLNVRNLIAVQVFFILIFAFYGFVYLRKKSDIISFDKDIAKKSFSYGFIVYLGVIANVLHFKIDQVMINYILGTAEVGIYAISVQWAEALFLLDGAIISASLYKISSSGNETSYLLTKKMFKILVVVSGAAGFGLLIFSYPLIHTLYGSEYVDAVWPMIFLIPGVVAWSAGKILSQYISYNRGRKELCTYAAFFGMAVNVLLNFPMISSYGIKGAAIASTLSYLLVLMFLMIIHRYLGEHNA